MSMLPGRPSRRHPIHYPVLAETDRPIVAFVTVCSARRRPILADRDAMETLLNAWREADSWLVGRYVIMPDHIHLFCSPRDVTVPLVRWVQFWKSVAARRWPRRGDHPLWQTDFWDTQLRGFESYESKWEYVRLNPVRHGLVSDPDAWPYAGEMNLLTWE